MTPRIYTVHWSAVTIGTAVQDLIEVTAPATGAICLCGAMLGQTTELGEGQEEHIRLMVRRGTSTTTSGSGGSAVTPVPLTMGDAAATLSAERNNTTQMATGSGTITDVLPFYWPVRGGWDGIWPEWVWVTTQASARLTVAVAAVTADALDAGGAFFVAELF